MVEVREDWLALVQEEIIDPERRIVDPHHHFFLNSEHGFPDYLLDHFWRDTGSGHRVEQTVFIDCSAEYRTDGPEELKSLGQTEWVESLANEAANGAPGAARVNAIVGFVDLGIGARAREVLQQHQEASSRFRGIRYIVAWDEDESVPSMDVPGPDYYRDPQFREGFAQLAPLGLSFDAWHYHPQTQYLIELARAFPETSIVMDHLATPIRGGAHGSDEDVFQQWKQDVTELATCSNVVMKLGGMLMPWNGYGWDTRERPGTSDELVEQQGLYYRHAIEAFGPGRCMFESNFPADKGSLSYHVAWNAFKKLVADFSESEKDAMFSGTAMRVYGLDPID